MRRSESKRVAVLWILFAAAHLWAGTPPLQRVTQIPALQPLPMTISGRVQTVADHSLPAGFGGRQYRSQWPGTVFQAAFRGSKVFLSVGTNHEILHVQVDGQMPLLLTRPEPGVYRLTGLQPVRHIIRVLVATESQEMPNSFGGFGVPAGEKPLAPPTPPARQIEFIGDSHTVGYGNTSPKRSCTPDEVWATTDDTQALGALTAAHYGADFQVNAISGRGVVRNYNGTAGATLPEAYSFVLLDRTQVYRDPAWKPQVIVIALGTNDFSTALNPGERWKTRGELDAAYEAQYLRFLEHIHARDPQASILLWATDMARGEVEAEVGRVAQQARAKGLSRLTFLPIDHLQFSGCASHPSLADHGTIRDRLIQVIDAQPGIWRGK